MLTRTRSLIPTTQDLLFPAITPDLVKEKLIMKNRKYRSVYDRRDDVLPELEIGQAVIIQGIIQTLNTRPYIVNKPQGTC